MKLTAGLLIGAGLILLVSGWARPTAWLMTRLPPETPSGHRPRTRTWIHGIEAGPWPSGQPSSAST